MFNSNIDLEWSQKQETLRSDNIQVNIFRSSMMLFIQNRNIVLLVSTEQGKYLEQRAPQKPSSLHQITLTAPKLHGKGFIQNTILAFTHFIQME